MSHLINFREFLFTYSGFVLAVSFPFDNPVSWFLHKDLFNCTVWFTPFYLAPRFNLRLFCEVIIFLIQIQYTNTIEK